MNMKFIFAVFFITVCTTLSAQQVINDPNAQVREVGDFNKVSVSNAFDVYLVQGNENGVVVSASDNESRDRILTTVKNGTLHISLEPGKNIMKRWGNNKMNLKAYISFKNLDAISASGACNVRIMNQLSANQLTIDLSGASNIDGKINAKQLDVELSGASDCKINGVAENLKVSASGASDFKGYALQSSYCVAEASGASSVQVTVNKELSAEASGASSVSYAGDGSVKNMRSSGASNIRKRS